jgi:hypothetical protein
MWPIDRLRELWDWLVALPPDFAFLLSMPLLVALTGALRALALPARSARGDELRDRRIE